MKCIVEPTVFMFADLLLNVGNVKTLWNPGIILAVFHPNLFD